MSGEEVEKLIEAKPDELWLPAWAFNIEAQQWLQQKVFCNSWTTVSQPTDGREVLGPAKRWACLGLGTLWAFFVTFPILAWAMSTCATTGIAIIPPWPKWTYFCCLSVCMWIEWKCLQYAITRPANEFPLAKTCAPFKFLGFALSYRRWLALSMLLSFLGHGSVSTAGLFMAKALATDLCPSAGAQDTIPEIWKDISEKSLLMRSLNVQVQFSTLVIVAWGLMILQPLVALLEVVPLSRKPGYTEDFYEPSNSDAAEYKTLLNAQQNHFTAVVALADASKMGSVADACSALVRFQGENDRSYQTINAVFFEMRRVIIGFALRGLIEGAFRINLQVTFWVLCSIVEREGSESDIEMMDMTFVSICFTIFDAVKTLAGTYGKLFALRRYLKRLAEAMKVYVDMFDMPWYHGPTKEETPGFVEPTSVLQSAERWFVGFVGITVLYCIAFAFAGVKLAMAFRCSDRIWELGCVDLS